MGFVRGCSKLGWVWKPCEIASRLREANKVAGHQSKLSHDTAKRYYDRQVKWEQFKKGDFVYMRDPTYKRGKAKKFSYQYKGPFEIKQRISSLIYTVRLGDGTCAIVHVNRLKRAFERGEDSKIPVGENTPSSRTGGTDLWGANGHKRVGYKNPPFFTHPKWRAGNFEWIRGRHA
jgi:hypothetical protein